MTDPRSRVKVGNGGPIMGTYDLDTRWAAAQE